MRGESMESCDATGVVGVASQSMGMYRISPELPIASRASRRIALRVVRGDHPPRVKKKDRGSTAPFS
jgi:hypothetical protein